MIQFTMTASGAASQSTSVIRAHHCHGCGEECGIYHWRGQWYGENCAEFYGFAEKDEVAVDGDDSYDVHCKTESWQGRYV